MLRTGIVLDRNTPALDRLVGITRWGLGGRVGSGDQWVSWLHIDDWIAIVREALVPTGAPLEGVVHATSPNPVRNRELMAALRRTLRRPTAPPTPTPLVRLGAALLRTDPALALTGRPPPAGPLTSRTEPCGQGLAAVTASARLLDVKQAVGTVPRQVRLEGHPRRRQDS